jgi:hypothetical protein
MSMHYHMPGHAVLADSWTLFCPECSQKMRLIMATPALDGRATRTYECVFGHRERMTAGPSLTGKPRASGTSHLPAGRGM